MASSNITQPRVLQRNLYQCVLLASNEHQRVADIGNHVFQEGCSAGAGLHSIILTTFVQEDCSADAGLHHIDNKVWQDTPEL